jgi:hypothetical protein
MVEYFIAAGRYKIVVHNMIEVAVDRLPVASKNAPIDLIPNILWSVGALFALSLALIVSATVLLCMICLFRLADLNERSDEDPVGQVLLLQEHAPLSMNILTGSRHRLSDLQLKG